MLLNNCLSSDQLDVWSGGALYVTLIVTSLFAFVVSIPLDVMEMKYISCKNKGKFVLKLEHNLFLIFSIIQTRNIFKKDIRRLSNTDDKRNQITKFPSTPFHAGI